MQRSVLKSLCAAALALAATSVQAEPEAAQQLSLVSCKITPAAASAGLLDPVGYLYVLAPYENLVGALLGETTAATIAIQTRIETSDQTGLPPMLVTYSGFKLSKGAAAHTLALSGEFEGQSLEGTFSTAEALQPASLTIGGEAINASCSTLNIGD